MTPLVVLAFALACVVVWVRTLLDPGNNRVPSFVWQGCYIVAGIVLALVFVPHGMLNPVVSGLAIAGGAQVVASFIRAH